MYPLLLKDVDGRKKFIFSDEEARELRLRVDKSLLTDGGGNVIPAMNREDKGLVAMEVNFLNRVEPLLDGGKKEELREELKPASEKKIIELQAVVNEASATIISKNKGGHGLAPMGMSIPKKGEAYLVAGKDNVGTEELKESSFERYKRVGEELNEKRKNKERKDVKKLKKEGKVGPLAPYMNA